MPQPLSSKEASLFRTVVRNYEDKQYKKGLKAAEQILKKNPKHGDTLAMKALILNSTDKAEEAFALGKIALQCDMKSHVCWHVYGLLYRSAKNFEEAIKAYKFALRLDPENAQIQRDLALLQVQIRDYEGYVASRRAMLQARSHMRQNWTALAVAQHLAGNLAEAESVLTTYEETLKSPPSRTDFENSEAVLYKNSIIAEMGDTTKALEHLDATAKHSLDRLAYTELRARYLAKLNRKDEAAKMYRMLIERNAEYKEYYDGLASVVGIDSENTESLKSMYDGYAEKFPRSDAARRLPLDFLQGEDFEKAATSYIHRMLNKGVPSTFANLKHLYADPFKRKALPAAVEAYLDRHGSAIDGNTETNGDVPKGKAAAFYFLAQHYNYHLSRDLQKAMDFVEKAIELEPKSVDFHMTKARIWKHHGDSQKASQTMEQARQLDTRDRYINTKSAKYKLRNNENDEALTTMGMFTRQEAVGGPLADLHDMQCLWFLTEDGEAFARRKQVGLALKRFHSVFKVFDTWQEDQFDFHNFSLRKGQIRAYIDMMRWEDRLRSHPAYTRAALAAIELYLKIDDRSLSNGTNGNHDNEEDTSAAKKAAKKARKDAQKAAEVATAKKNEPNKAKDPDGNPKKVDEDPQGATLAATSEPLLDAMRFLSPLLEMSPRNIDGQLAGAELYTRRKKYLPALKCLLTAHKLSPTHPRLHEQIVRFHQATSSVEISPRTSEVIASEFNLLPKPINVSEYNETFLAKHKHSAPHVFAVQRVRKSLPSCEEAKVESDIMSTLDLPEISLDDAISGLFLLKSWRSSETKAYTEKAARKWPCATVFSSVQINGST